VPIKNEEYFKIAKKIIRILPKSNVELITDSTSAECVKYIANAFLLTKTVYMNIAYDAVIALGGQWDDVIVGVTSDSRIGSSHTRIYDNKGRGAGGNCLIKDFEAFISYLDQKIKLRDIATLSAIKYMNIDLLLSSQKDMAILESIYGSSLTSFIDTTHSN